MSLFRRRAGRAFRLEPLRPGRLAEQERKERVALMAGIGAGSVLLWQTALGSMLLYPFTILATWFHEMGHGVASMAAGRGFERLMIFADGSGVAMSLRPAGGYGVTDALIAASGPLGPAVAGALLILASRSAAAARYALAGLGAALVVSTAIWVRSPVGWLVLPGLGLGMAALAWRGSPAWRSFAVQLLGVQAAIGAWSELDYLFSPGGSVGGALQRSDTAAIADVLFLPYWFWGAAISAAILALLWSSFRLAFRPTVRPPRSRGRP